MIQIKSHYSDWREVDREKAKKYVKFLKNRITNIPENKKNEFINKYRLKGITVEELEKEARR